MVANITDLALQFDQISKISTESLNCLISTFEKLDKKDRGYLRKSDIRKHLKAIKEPYDRDTIENIMSKCDQNKDGKIQFDEFFAIFNHQSLAKYEKVFSAYDADGNGFLDVGELKKLMITIDKIEDDVINEMFMEADKNKDGFLSFSEFYEVCKF